MLSGTEGSFLPDHKYALDLIAFYSRRRSHLNGCWGL